MALGLSRVEFEAHGRIASIAAIWTKKLADKVPNMPVVKKIVAIIANQLRQLLCGKLSPTGC